MDLDCLDALPSVTLYIYLQILSQCWQHLFKFSLKIPPPIASEGCDLGLPIVAAKLTRDNLIYNCSHGYAVNLGPADLHKVTEIPT
jgi:hypothetical protein